MLDRRQNINARRNIMTNLISERYIGRQIGKILIEEMDYCIYFVSDGEFIKIGSAASLPNRIKQLQTGNPRKLKAVFVINVEKQSKLIRLEKELHEKFKEYRVNGEWFKLDEEYIEKLLLREGYDLRIPASKRNFDLDGILVI